MCSAVRPPPLHLTSDRLLLKAFAAGLLVLVAVPLDEGLLSISISLWLTHGGSMATDGATDWGAGSMSMVDGVSAVDVAGCRGS